MTYLLLRSLPPHSIVRAEMLVPSALFSVIPVQALACCVEDAIRTAVASMANSLIFIMAYHLLSFRIVQVRLPSSRSQTD